MKIAIPSSGTDLNAPLDLRFGRAQYFLIYDTDTSQVTVLENKQNLNAAQGAGIQSAQTVAQAKAEVLLAGNCGPKAYTVLQQAGIKIFIVNSGSVQNAVDAYLSGGLTEAESANVKGHWQ